MEYITFQNINKYYGKAHILKDVNLDVCKGELVTLLGLSGCGKSTLLRCLAGLEDVSEGNIFLAGEDVTHKPPRERQIGMVFQQYSLFPNMTVSENTAFGLKMKKELNQSIKEKVSDILDVVGLTDQKNKYPYQLSGGQQQRVALARAIVMEPKVLLLDEPLSAIDALLRKNLQIEIRRLHKEFNMTTIFVTHDQDEAMVMSDTIHLMYEGKIEQSGTPVDVYTKPATPFAANFIGHYNLLKSADFNLVTGGGFEGESVAFRPECVRLSDTPKEDDQYFAFKGIIQASLSHGSIMRYNVLCNETVIDVDALYNQRLRFADGDTVYLNILKNDCIIYE